jgi:phage major head subunit gpT-like protein
MIINKTTLLSLAIAFRAAFASGLGMAPSNYKKVATVVPSTTSANEYGWLGKFPKMREWIGDRVVNGMSTFGYTIRNKAFELTIGVSKPDIDDDNLGIYTPMFTEMGQSTGEQPDEMVFNLLKNGHNTVCYDGQYFFDTDHPVIGVDGVTVASQSNVDDNAGAGTPWYLLDCSRALKPVIYQERQPANFVAKDRVDDDNVFDRNEYKYGVDMRCNVGFGFWQQAYRSRKDMTEANLLAAFTAMTERKGDNDRTLGIKPTILAVPPSLEWAARKLINATTLANGADNVLKGLVEVMVDSRLN